jgi:hypothetical protein
LEKADPLALPRCELCKQNYSAELKLGKKQLSRSQLMQKIASKTYKQIFSVVFVIMAFAMIPWILMDGIVHLVMGDVEDGIAWCFSKFVFPMVFLWSMRERC